MRLPTHTPVECQSRARVDDPESPAPSPQSVLTRRKTDATVLLQVVAELLALVLALVVARPALGQRASGALKRLMGACGRVDGERREQPLEVFSLARRTAWSLGPADEPLEPMCAAPALEFEKRHVRSCCAGKRSQSESCLVDPPSASGDSGGSEELEVGSWRLGYLIWALIQSEAWHKTART